MGKSPGKWIKGVLFGKKSSKSNLSKHVTTTERKASMAAKAPSGDLALDSLVISDPLPQAIDTSGEALSDKSSSVNLPSDAGADGRGTAGFNAENDAELTRQEEAATKAQAAFRGYLARRAFWALKGIIRLQALVRGHLVRRQAVATLRCMRAIVEFQALVRGRRVRLSGAGRQVLEMYTPAKLLDVKRGDLLEVSLRSEKLSTNVFATKLLAYSRTTTPLSLHYDPVDPNSAWNWLERWSSSCFWEPLVRPKKMLDAKLKRKTGKLQTEEAEAGKSKRTVRRANGDNNASHSSETEKPKRNARKVLVHQAEPVQEQPHNELEKVKRNLRKISQSTTTVSEKSEAVMEKPQPVLEKVPSIPTPDSSVPVGGMDQTSEKVIDPTVLEPEAPPIPPLEDKPLDVLHDDYPAVEPESIGNGENSPTVNEEQNCKEDQTSKENSRARRRKSFPAKQDYHPESVSQNTPTLPSYMAATESAKAKLRAQGSSPRTAEDAAENGFTRRHSLPSSTNGKLSLLSPRVQKPVQANGKGGSKSNKSLVSPKDEKVLQAGWKR